MMRYKTLYLAQNELENIPESILICFGEIKQQKLLRPKNLDTFLLQGSDMLSTQLILPNIDE